MEFRAKLFDSRTAAAAMAKHLGGSKGRVVVEWFDLEKVPSWPPPRGWPRKWKVGVSQGRGKRMAMLGEDGQLWV